MRWLEVDPSVVRPGWTPLLILVLMGAALVLLYFSMRRQFRRIDVTRFQGGTTPAAAAAPEADPAQPGEASGPAEGGSADDHTGQASRR